MTGRAPTAALVGLLAGLLPAAAAGCGGGSDELHATEARAMVVDMFRSVVVNDKEAILSHILPDAGLGDNAIAAQALDTKEGLADHREGQRRWFRLAMRDSAITDLKQMDRFSEALKVTAQGNQAYATFEIAENKEEKRSAEKVILRLIKRDDRWFVRDYERKILR